MSNLNSLIERMENEIDTDNFIEIMDNCIQEIEESGIGIEAVEPLLQFIERHPLSDFGTPGSIVHFVEKFYKQGYEPLLISSVKRCPTMHTVWMLNRVKNGEQEQQVYFEILNDIVHNKDIEEEIRRLAQDFLS
ncbi:MULTISPECIES: hypothetical protein [Terrabacteria group]|uniref:hypothetical protein n=1 Tax=Bacillati TaxID=1783272 RepID=UPI001C6EFF36|nr:MULTISPECIES: hypothetical protein [Terrabacteria group]MBW9212974.1 hypothetical protein [Trueperella sp. zg.1013]